MNAKKLIFLTAFSMVAATTSNIFLTDPVFAKGSPPSLLTPPPLAATPSGGTPVTTPPPLVIGNSTSRNATSGNMTK